jgi:hypothetical protein
MLPRDPAFTPVLRIGRIDGSSANLNGDGIADAQDLIVFLNDHNSGD